MTGASGDLRGETPEVRAALLRALVDKLPAMLAYWDSTLHCRFANRAYERWFGVTAERMIGREMSEFLGPLFALNQPYIEAALRGEEQEFEREIPDPAGGPARHSQAHYIPDVDGGVVRGFCVLVVDITRRKRAEQALLQLERQLQATERLASLATLAAGLAHEINNPLAYVLANVELALEAIERGPLDPAELKAGLEHARHGAERVSKIVQSMKLLARGRSSRSELVDVNDTLQQSLELTANVLRYRARVVQRLGQVPRVLGDSSQLAQVFVNLLVNAAQALPAERVAHNQIGVSSRAEGGRVIVEIADNGPGIAPELRARIFEPFFTTKDVGGGMGLGLTISAAIVGGLGGALTVESEVGAGSTFRVALPAAASDALEAPHARSAALEAAPAPQRLELLIVDDEPNLTLTLRLLLERDHHVAVANGGREALAALDARPFDLILCDLMMPEVSGIEVYARATAKDPSLARRFLFMTGGAFTAEGRQFLASVGSPVVDKPFDGEQLRRQIAAQAALLPPIR